VLDIPGGFGKVPVNADHVGPMTNGGRQIQDIRGALHHYPE
jgi:hypothetical protein